MSLLEMPSPTLDQHPGGSDLVLYSRMAEARDLEAILQIERDAWAACPSMAADAHQLTERIRMGLVLATFDLRTDRVVGYVTCFRPSWTRASVLDQLVSNTPPGILNRDGAQRWTEVVLHYGLPPNWYAATNDGDVTPDRLHNPSGDVLFCLGLVTDPAFQGRGIGNHTLAEARKFAQLCGARYLISYGRDREVSRRMFANAGARPARSSDGVEAWLDIPDARRDDDAIDGRGFLAICSALSSAPRAIAKSS